MAKNTTAAALATLLAAAALGGCATDNGATGEGASVSPAGAAATPLGVFALVPNAPPGFDDLGGTAELVDGSDGGSDVSIALSGLKPDVRYRAHVHAGNCDQPDPGGPHFKFDLNGSDTPPNEIHLRFVSNAVRNASAQAHSTRRVPAGAAGSIVVHQQTAAPGSGVAGAKPQAAGGHERHGGGSDGGSASANAAGGHSHSHADKIACAALREPARSDGAGATAPAPPGQSPDGETLAIRVTGKEPVGGVQQVVVRKGDRVRFTVTSDQAEQVHVHAYDVIEDVGPGAPARFDFAAEIEGVYEVELERAGVQILSLTVNPR